MSHINKVHQEVLNQFYNANNVHGSLAQAALEADAERYRAFRKAAIEKDMIFYGTLMHMITEDTTTVEQFDHAIDVAKGLSAL